MKIIEIMEAQSSWIAELLYDNDSQSVVLQTRSGKQYVIENVPRDIYDQWQSADSAGKFFHHNIKNQYTIRK